MFHTLPRHAKYRPNSSPWLGDLPEHWLLARTKTLLNERSQKGYPEEPLLAATQRHGVIKKSDYETRTVTATKDLHLLKLVEVGDFVISLRSFQGGIERCYHRGIISPAYTVLTANDEAHREFLKYLFKSRPFVDSLTLAVTGIREGQNIDYSRLEVDLLPVPPPEEQAAIVKYLTHANARIDNAIAAKRRLIALLEEQMRVLVERAISECTASLERLGFHIELATGFPFKSEDFRTTRGDGQRPLIRGINVGVGSLSSTDYVFVDEDIAQLAQSFELRVGDLVLGMDRPVIAKGVRLAEITSQQAGCLLVQRVARLRTKSTLEPSYLQTVFRSAAFTQYLEPIFTGISVPHLSPKQIRDFSLPMPTIDEQRAIVAAVGSRTTKLESAVNVAAREVVLLQEFRTRLVADVVTGQVDVRAVAATLLDTPTSVLVADDVPADADGLWEDDDG